MKPPGVRRRGAGDDLERARAVDGELALLSNRRRRDALVCLIRSADEVVPFQRVAEFVERRERARLDDADAADVGRRIAISLHHTHLPKLSDASAVTYRPRERTVEYHGTERLERLAELAEELAEVDG